MTMETHVGDLRFQLGNVFYLFLLFIILFVLCRGCVINAFVEETCDTAARADGSFRTDTLICVVRRRYVDAKMLSC